MRKGAATRHRQTHADSWRGQSRDLRHSTRHSVYSAAQRAVRLAVELRDVTESRRALHYGTLWIPYSCRVLLESESGRIVRQLGRVQRTSGWASTVHPTGVYAVRRERDFPAWIASRPFSRCIATQHGGVRSWLFRARSDTTTRDSLRLLRPSYKCLVMAQAAVSRD